MPEPHRPPFRPEAAARPVLPAFTCALALLLSCAGCRPWALRPQPPATLDPILIDAPDEVVAEAVTRSLDAFFADEWDYYDKVYLEPGPHLPPRLTQVGRYEVEVISQEQLSEKFGGRRVAPALTRVTVVPEPGAADGRFRVSISYTPVNSPGAAEFPVGAGQTYSYRAEDGRAVLLGMGEASTQ